MRRLICLVKSIWNDHRYYRNQESRISFHLDVPKSAVFYSDKTRLRIIFSNLISNAIKFHLEEQQEPYIQVSARDGEHEYEFVVADNGRGMSLEVQNKIFEMFFKGNADATGSGLGLYILKESVAKLNGRVAVVSEVGHGSKFIISIPKPAVTPAATPDPVAQSLATVA